MYGSDSTLQDFEKAYQKFLQEAEQGNGFAMHDLGRMFADGLGRDADVGLAQKWYEKALEAFLVREESVKRKRRNPICNIVLGKCMLLVWDQNKIMKKRHTGFLRRLQWIIKYAQYSLAGLYRRGRGVEQNNIRAFSLYMSSAEQGNPYASLELAKMYRDGFGTEPDLQQAEWRFQNAYSGFCGSGRKSHDDKLQYRIGQMLHTGTGTSKDDEGGPGIGKSPLQSWGNINAQYALGTLWLAGSGRQRQAVEWLKSSKCRALSRPVCVRGNYTRMVCILIKIWIRP